MQNPSDSEPIVLNEEPTFPGYSTFQKKKHCCCMMTYYPEIKTYFWGEWEFQPIMPTFVLLLIISSFIVLVSVILPYFRYEWIIVVPIQIFLLIMFVYSYIEVIYVGPGYLPFYHMGAQTGTLPENPQDYMISGYVCPPDGIITSEKQYTWAHNLPKPSRATLTHSARRYVIRADHLCGWTTVWIGKRNYKMFMLFNFYGTPYLGIFTAYCIRYFIKCFDSLDIPPLVTVAIYGILSLSFTLLTFAFSISSLSLACNNRTNWEDWNTVTDDYDRGSCKQNMEDVCGTPSSIWDYFCPRSPFTNITNDELVRQYDP